MRDHTKLRAFEAADEVVFLIYRATREFSKEEGEIENTNKGGPIALADYTIINESSLPDLEKQANKLLASLK